MEHIKGTLIQFLKQTPLTESKNEELLRILFSMMMFSAAEQHELTQARMSLQNVETKKNNRVSGKLNTSAGLLDTSKEKKQSKLFSMFKKA